MKSTIATILGTAALGLLKKQMGSSTRLMKKTEYEYNMDFTLMQDGGSWVGLPLLTMKEVLWNMQLLDEEPIGFVNELHSTLFEPFIIYTPCAKYTAHCYEFNNGQPAPNKTMEKLMSLCFTLENGDGPQFSFKKENDEPIDPEEFHHEFWLIREAIITNVLNKFSSLVYRRFPELNCKAKWRIVDEEFIATDIYSHFMNSDGTYPISLSGFAEDILLGGIGVGNYEEQSYSGWDAFRTEKIYNVDTGEEYKSSRPKDSKLRKR